MIKQEYNKKWWADNPTYFADWGRKNVASRLTSVAKQRARRRNVEFNITKEDVVVPTHCPILGIELAMNYGTGAGGKDSSFSLDRIDQSKGYVKGNVQVISHKANSMKFTASKEELIKFADWVYSQYGKD